MANKNHGSMARIMMNAATLFGKGVLNITKRKSGNPVTAAALKHITCLFVNARMNLLLISLKSLGTDT